VAFTAIKRVDFVFLLRQTVIQQLVNVDGLQYDTIR